jgi:hypothetical protein
MKTLLILCTALFLGLSAAAAQTPCEHHNPNSYCESRDLTLPFSGALEVDTGGIGAITVQGWDNDYVSVHVQIDANADTESQARIVASLVQIQVATGQIWASGPAGTSWIVTFEIFLPRGSALRLNTRVGALSIAGVSGAISARTSVGAIALSGVAGDVQARTSVGAISIVLTGARWDGKGLTATTSTGAIHIVAPAAYAAHFDLRTDVGNIVTTFPARVLRASFVGKKLVFDASGGGAPIQASTSVGQIELIAAR